MALGIVDGSKLGWSLAVLAVRLEDTSASLPLGTNSTSHLLLVNWIDGLKLRLESIHTDVLAVVVLS